MTTDTSEDAVNQPIAVDISFEERCEEPNWTLIEEISLPLLEQGIGSFDVLQQSLRSVALCRIDETDEENFSRRRLVKLLRLAQFHIEYLLKSQAVILEKLDASSKECQSAKEMTVALKKQLKAARFHCEDVIAAASGNNQVFECASCGKLFLSADFLLYHIRRRHRSSADQREHRSDEEASDFVEDSDKLSRVLLAICDLRQELLLREHTATAPIVDKRSPSQITLNAAVAGRLERLEVATDRILNEVLSEKRPASLATAPVELSHRIAPSPSPVPPETESGSMLLTAERYADQKLAESQMNIYESISPEIGGQFLNQSVGSADTSVWGSSMDSAKGLRQ